MGLSSATRILRPADAAAYDLALIDLQMPVMDGLSAIAMIRADEAAQGRERMPIIVLSANVMPEHLSASRAAGADAHIGKPINAQELFGAIATAMQPETASGSLLKAG